MKSVAIVGAGADGLRMWQALVQCGSVDVVGFVDDDSRLRGRLRAGLPIHPPDWLSLFGGDVVMADGSDLPPSLAHRIPAGRLVRLPAHLDEEALARIAGAVYPDPLAPLLAAPAVHACVRVGIFGTGAAGTKVWEALAEVDDCEPLWFADNDVRQQGRELLWLPVIAPGGIRMRDADVVVIGSMSREPIRRQLLSFGIPPWRILTPDVSASVDGIGAELRRLLSAFPSHEVRT